MPKNHKKYVLSSLATVPASASKAGDITSAGRWVAGVGTEFKSDKTIVEGDWIFAGGEIRRIERIVSDESIYLEEAFTADIAVATALEVVKASRAREISLVNIGGATATVDGSNLIANASLSFDETMLYRGSQRDYPDPLVVDASTSDVDVLIVY
jgi:hypothetical protein